MAEIRDLSAIKDKWTRVTPGRTEDYKIGIKNPRRDWEKETSGAADTYKAGVDAAHTKGLFAKSKRRGPRSGKQRHWKKDRPGLPKASTLPVMTMRLVSLHTVKLSPG
jgi:hypothetical protein